MEHQEQTIKINRISQIIETKKHGPENVVNTPFHYLRLMAIAGKKRTNIVSNTHNGFDQSFNIIGGIWIATARRRGIKEANDQYGTFARDLAYNRHHKEFEEVLVKASKSGQPD